MATHYFTATSIDGYIADPDHSLEWLFQVSDAPGIEEDYPRFIADVGAIAMGSSTYQWLIRQTGFLDDPSKWEYEMPAWVFSSRELPKPEGLDIRLVAGDVRPVHEAMVEAAAGKNVWIVGGGELVGQFYDAGLLDDIFLSVASVFLGAGAPLLPRRILSSDLELVQAKAYGTGFATLHYRIRRAS